MLPGLTHAAAAATATPGLGLRRDAGRTDELCTPPARGLCAPQPPAPALVDREWSGGGGADMGAGRGRGTPLTLVTLHGHSLPEVRVEGLTRCAPFALHPCPRTLVIVFRNWLPRQSNKKTGCEKGGEREGGLPRFLFANGACLYPDSPPHHLTPWDPVITPRHPVVTPRHPRTCTIMPPPLHTPCRPWAALSGWRATLSVRVPCGARARL